MGLIMFECYGSHYVRMLWVLLCSNVMGIIMAECYGSYYVRMLWVLLCSNVAKGINVLSYEYINPFVSSLDKDNLFNLISGVPLSEDLDRYFVLSQKRGKECKKVENERFDNNHKSFHEPIKRLKLKTWKSSETKIMVSKNEKNASIEINRNIIGKLLALSAKTDKVIDFKKALELSLAPVPLSLANPSDTKRTKSQKQTSRGFNQNMIAAIMSSTRINFVNTRCQDICN